MTTTYRVIDLRPDSVDAEHDVTGFLSPELATANALGVDVTRSGRAKDLVGKVYFKPLGQPVCMVRMYARKETANTPRRADKPIVVVDRPVPHRSDYD